MTDCVPLRAIFASQNHFHSKWAVKFQAGRFLNFGSFMRVFVVQLLLEKDCLGELYERLDVYRLKLCSGMSQGARWHVRDEMWHKSCFVSVFSTTCDV